MILSMTITQPLRCKEVGGMMCVGGGEDRDRGIMSVVSWGLSGPLCTLQNFLGGC
jgi:hypothetical protein